MHLHKKEKPTLFLYLALTFFLFNLSLNAFPAQKKPQEEVTVTAVEVPVRVFHKGQMVKGLTKEDFEIYENGVKQDITSFEIISRKMSIPLEQRKTHQKKRLFILVFNIFDYNDAVGEGIDFFFQDVFQKGDQFLVLTEDRILNIKKGDKLPEVTQNIKGALKKFKHISTQNTLKTFRDLRVEADTLLAMLRGDALDRFNPADRAMMKFFENYQRDWADYKRQYITPNISFFRNMLGRIKQMEGEKWAICFQQREMFPKLKNEGPLDSQISDWVSSQVEPQEQAKARLVHAKKMELQRSFDLTQNFPADSLRDLFMEANITYHLILLKSFRTVISNDFELKEVASDYEECLKKISSATGGSSVFSNKVSDALLEATDKEDTYYLLVYSPREKKGIKKREIDVKVKKDGVEVIHLKNFPEIEEPFITVSGFMSGRKTIKFSLINYKQIKKEGELTGTADIRITIFDENSNKVFDEGKTLTLIKEKTDISLNFNFLKSGSHFIIIQAIDRISQKSDVFSSAIEL